MKLSLKLEDPALNEHQEREPAHKTETTMKSSKVLRNSVAAIACLNKYISLQLLYAEQEEGSEEEEEVGEISSEVQQLLQRLEGKIQFSSEVGPSLGWIVVELHGKHTRIMYRLFDTTDKSYKSWKEFLVLLGAQAKYRLLQAIGSCKTLRRIMVDDLTGNELEALLTPMQFNPVVDQIYINSVNLYITSVNSSEAKRAYAAYSPNIDPLNSRAAKMAYSPNEYAERICKILGRILQTSRTLNTLKLYLWGLTAAGACHLASGVRGNAESALEVFYTGKLEESSVANQVAEIVLAAPRLRELELWKGGVIDDDGTDALADALAQSTSLTLLWLHGVVRGASALLLKALTGDGSNKSIATLQLTDVEGVGDFLPLLLSTNRSLKELVCNNPQLNLSPYQWRSVGKSLSCSSSLGLFRVGVPWSSFRQEARDGGEALLSSLDMKTSCVGLYLNSAGSVTRKCPWGSPSEWKDEDARELLREINVKKNPVIELHLFLFELKDLSTMWVSLAEALNNKGTHLSSLYLQMSPQLEMAKGLGGEVDNFFQALRSSSTLRVLTVDGGNGWYWYGGWTKLIDSLRYYKSITHLRLIDCDDLDDYVFIQLVGVLQVNSTLKRIRLKGTSWETDGKKALIEEALRQNAERDFSTFRTHKVEFHAARLKSIKGIHF